MPSSFARQAGDFFDPIGQRIAAGDLFLTLRRRESVGFGLLERSALYEDVASVGMYTHRTLPPGAASARRRSRC